MTVSTLDLFAWLGFAVLLWVAREMGLGLWAWRKARRFDHVLKVERTRGQFATIRNRLAGLVVEERLDANSVSFKRLYLVNTVFMRSPDRYPALCSALEQAIFSHKKRPNPELLRESKTWTPEVRHLVIETADAMQQVLIDYSWFFSVYFYVAKRKFEMERRRIDLEQRRAALEHRRAHSRKKISERVVRAVKVVTQKIVAILEKHNPVVFDIRKAQAVMYRMAQ